MGESSASRDCLSATINRISVANMEKLLISQYNHYFNEKASDENVKCYLMTKGFLKLQMSQSRYWMDTAHSTYRLGKMMC